jgi:ribosome assembly protein YihI (activator of Der GTPase)
MHLETDDRAALLRLAQQADGIASALHALVRYQTNSANALLDALDKLEIGRFSDDQLDRLAQIVDALAVEIDQEYMRRDTRKGTT